MSATYSSWSLDKLNKEKIKIEKAIKIKQNRTRKAVIAEMTAVAKSNGFDLQDLLSDSAAAHTAGGKLAPNKNARKSGTPVKKRGPVKPKYQNPADKSQKWTGRGKQPLWVKAFLSKGGKMSDITI